MTLKADDLVLSPEEHQIKMQCICFYNQQSNRSSMIKDSLLLESQHSDGPTLLLQYTLSKKKRWCCINNSTRRKGDKTTITTHL